MSDKNQKHEEIFSKALRAGRRTYFFDTRSTRAGDYYLTITESKKFTNDDGSYFYKKHKIYLYKEDFADFKEYFEEVTDFIIGEKGREVISGKHNPDYKKEDGDYVENEASSEKADSFTDVKFEDI